MAHQQDSVAVTITTSPGGEVPIKKKKSVCWRWDASIVESLVGSKEARRLIHGVKVGIALVLVSLLYILEVVHDRLGDNAMWAIMTVVVVFELFSGATIGKGVNRGIGTISGGGLGFLVALMAQDIGGKGKAVVIATALFIFGAAATYTRQIPKVKKKYDYGVMIFILTFSLVAVSGVRGDQIVKVASDRLSSISMGFAICIFISLFVFPIWASDELHSSLVSKFNNLAPLVEESVKEYFRINDEKPNNTPTPCNFKACLSVLHSKTSDESLANFAKWEPWHGRFGFNYPWDKYLLIGGQLRELAIAILSLKSCLNSKCQASSSSVVIREQMEATGMLIGSTLRELGAYVNQMTKCDVQELLIAKLQQMREELSSPMLLSELGPMNGGSGRVVGNKQSSIICLVFVLVDMIDRLEELVKKVDELGTRAGFHPQ